MTEAGFHISTGIHPIVPIILYDAVLAQNFAKILLERGIYVTGFFFPVMPKEKVRIRVQLSAAHDLEHVKKAVKAFVEVGVKLGVI